MSAKEIIVRPVPRAEAVACVERWHYSGRAYVKSRLHLGVFYRGDLLGAIQLGPSIDTRHSLAIVPGTPWNGYLEINRMALSDALPRCAESRALGVVFRQLRAHAPHVQWVVSYSDATQCGDGAIYRAAGMLLTQVRKNSTLYRTPSGDIVSDVGIRTSTQLRRRLGLTGVRRRDLARAGLTRLLGYQIRYMQFLDPAARLRYAGEILSYQSIPWDARMTRGHRACTLVEGSELPAPRGVRPDLHAPISAQQSCDALTWAQACAALPTDDRALDLPEASELPDPQLGLAL